MYYYYYYFLKKGFRPLRREIWIRLSTWNPIPQCLSQVQTTSASFFSFYFGLDFCLSSIERQHVCSERLSRWLPSCDCPADRKHFSFLWNESQNWVVTRILNHGVKSEKVCRFRAVFTDSFWSFWDDLLHSTEGLPCTSHFTVEPLSDKADHLRISEVSLEKELIGYGKFDPLY